MLSRLMNCPRFGMGLFLAAMSAPVLAPLADAILPPAKAQRQTVPPPSLAAAQYSFAPIVKQAVPAVVNVYVRTRVQTFSSPFANDPMFGRMFDAVGVLAG